MGTLIRRQAAGPLAGVRLSEVSLAVAQLERGSWSRELEGLIEDYCEAAAEVDRECEYGHLGCACQVGGVCSDRARIAVEMAAEREPEPGWEGRACGEGCGYCGRCW